MSIWINIGDMDPKYGTSLIRNPRVDDDGFHADIVTIIPETDVGGSDRVFDITSGDLFLPKQMWASALKTIDTLETQDGFIQKSADGGLIPKGSDVWLLELAYAAKAFCGPENTNSILVGIGIPTFYDQESKFDGDVTLFPAGTSLWDIMRATVDGFDYVPPDHVPQNVTALDMIEGPYAGTPLNIRTMEDVLKIKAFQDLGVDNTGMPKVWEHAYNLPDHDSPFVERSAHEDGVIEEAGQTYQPALTKWIGPEEEDLIQAWERHYEDRRSQLSLDFGM